MQEPPVKFNKEKFSANYCDAGYIKGKGDSMQDVWHMHFWKRNTNHYVQTYYTEQTNAPCTMLVKEGSPSKSDKKTQSEGTVYNH